jgi:hypothetical protein
MYLLCMETRLSALFMSETCRDKSGDETVNLGIFEFSVQKNARTGRGSANLHFF